MAKVKDNKIKGRIVKECTCGKCNYVWWPRTESPVTCPKCKCRNWENYKR